MGALANAALLRVDPTFRSWVQTALVYVARQVLLNDSAAPVADQPVRRALALAMATSSDTYVPTFIMGIACDPSVCGDPNNWSATAPEMEQPIIDHVAALWTTAAHLAYPNGV